VPAALGEDHLEELEPARREGRLRAREVETPGTDEPLVEHRPDLAGRGLEALPPVGEGADVVASQVLHVDDGEVPRL
jgi:hypothetical protein